MKSFCKYICVSLLTVIPYLASAQALPFTAVDYSPLALAKGSVSAVETSSVAYAAFGNPASMAFSEKTADLGASYVSWSPSQVKTTMINAGGSYKVNDKIGVAAAYTEGSYEAYESFDLAGVSKGMFTPKQMYAGIGLSYKFNDALAFGVNAGYASQTFAEEVSYSALSADIYAMYVAGKMRFAAGLTELGPKVVSESGEFSLPAAVRLGCGYDVMDEADHFVSVAVDASYYLAGSVAAAFGASYEFKDMLAFRAGYRYGGESLLPSFASAGLGIRFAGVSLDLAYLFAGETLSNTLCVGLGYSF